MIHFSCKCGRKIAVDGKYAGKKGKCPQCQEIITIPPSDNSVSEHQGEPQGKPIIDHNNNKVTPLPKATKSCPFCGEEILYTAQKCKHCGEFLNSNNDKTACSEDGRKPSAPHGQSSLNHKGRFLIYAAAIGLVLLVSVGWWVQKAKTPLISKEEITGPSDAESQFNVGLVFVSGDASTHDYKEAFKWFSKAAKQEFAAAQYNLGVMYENGHGVPQDYKEAVRWYIKAADQGFTSAQYTLGIMYFQGQVVPQDYKKAFRWFNKAAEQGDAQSQYFLGIMYSKGEGVSQDDKKAIEWVTNAAEQGYVDAQYFLGLEYTLGDAVSADYAEAYKWCSLAAGQGNKRAGEHCDFLLEKMTPSRIAEAKRRADEVRRKAK